MGSPTSCLSPFRTPLRASKAPCLTLASLYGILSPFSFLFLRLAAKLAGARNAPRRARADRQFTGELVLDSGTRSRKDTSDPRHCGGRDGNLRRKSRIGSRLSSLHPPDVSRASCQRSSRKQLLPPLATRESCHLLVADWHIARVLAFWRISPASAGPLGWDYGGHARPSSPRDTTAFAGRMRTTFLLANMTGREFLGCVCTRVPVGT